MKKNHLISFLSVVVAAIVMASCGPDRKVSDAEPTRHGSLVLYYSQTGATQAVAEQLQAILGSDIEAIEAVVPYDGTYDETIRRCLEERQRHDIPKIKDLKSEIAKYDTIYLGYPIWFGMYATPIVGLLSQYDLDSLTIVPFCTFGSGGLEASTADLKSALPHATIAEGYGVRNARISAVAEELPAFLASNGYIAGDVEAVPDYSELKPVSEVEKMIFDHACGDYRFPLGTPVAVGQRSTSHGMDYIYTVVSKDQQGNDVNATIYVTVPADSVPVFTRVVR